MHRHLGIPEDVSAAEESFELLRAFAATDQLHVAPAWDRWPDAANWGVLLVDLARHVANAREKEEGVPAAETLADIRIAFEKEWSWDTGSVIGEVEAKK